MHHAHIVVLLMYYFERALTIKATIQKYLGLKKDRKYEKLDSIKAPLMQTCIEVYSLVYKKYTLVSKIPLV